MDSQHDMALLERNEAEAELKERLKAEIEKRRQDALERKRLANPYGEKARRGGRKVADVKHLRTLLAADAEARRTRSAGDLPVIVGASAAEGDDGQAKRRGKMQWGGSRRDRKGTHAISLT